MTIAGQLQGKRIAISGSTGFLGTALVERLLRTVPDCELVLLVRGTRRSTPAERVRKELLRNDAFDRLRETLGTSGFDEMCKRRIVAVSADVSSDGLGLSPEDATIFGSCDVVIHSAATVSFESPLDSAVNVNLLGPVRIARAIQDTKSKAHMVAVSTAYVAGSRRGPSPEELLPNTSFAVEADWRVEVKAAQRIKGDVDAESRSVANLEKFRKQARHELGAAGTPTLATRTEKLRVDWVERELIERGKARAQSLGWPDAYAYTKSLGERALLETRGSVPVSIVRPSIIESAFAEPKAGWIRGFRMAEPVIISYARGLLREFPGIPEGVVDVIPVDFVVAALIAIAARGPLESGPDVVQVASGSRNPLRYRQLVDLVHDYFSRNPLYDNDGQPIVVKKWTFPGRGSVQQQLERVTKNLQRAETVLAKLPLRASQIDIAVDLAEKRELAERALGYVTIYGAYTEVEAIYEVDRLLALYESLSDDDKKDFLFDPAAIHWPSFVQDVHLPSVVNQARVRTTPSKSVVAGNKTGELASPNDVRGSLGISKWGGGRDARHLRNILAPERHFAVFDLENTLIASNVVESYAWLMSRHLPSDERIRTIAKLVKEGRELLSLDRKDRGDFLRYFYRRYEGANAAELFADGEQLFNELLLAKSFPVGMRRVREHRALGHKTVLITGALDIVVEPLRPLFDHIVAAKLTVDANGKFTGELETVPATGEARALELKRWADSVGLSLTEGIAYADSASDLPLLEAVAFPVAVNAETKLATIAAKRGWHTERWSKSAGRPFTPLPIGRVLHPASRRPAPGSAIPTMARKIDASPVVGALRQARNLGRLAKRKYL